MLTKCWLSTITSDQMEGAGSHPAPFTGFMRVASPSTVHLLEALRASSLLILHVRSGFSLQGLPVVKRPQRVLVTGSKVFLQGVLTASQRQSSPPLFIFILLVSFLAYFAHKFVRRTHRNMANLHDGKFSTPFESVHFGGTNYIPREFMVTNTYFSNISQPESNCAFCG